MHLDPSLVLVSLGIGVVVGLTGMGGGALLTPVLVLAFGVPPLGAVSSDLVASLVMRPVGAAVHFRRGTVIGPLVGWLSLGSVPAAFAGVLVLRALGSGPSLSAHLKLVLGGVLLVAAAATLARRQLAQRTPPPAPPGAVAGAASDPAGPAVAIKPLPTVLIGVVGGLVVGMTSVGSGSLMIVALLLVYPELSLSELVGTDLVQAVPLVASAALGHALFGDVRLGLTASLVMGGVPGAYAGARLSARAPDHLIRPALVLVLAATGLGLVGLAPWAVAAVAGAGAGLAGAMAYAGARRRPLTRQRPLIRRPLTRQRPLASQKPSTASGP